MHFQVFILELGYLYSDFSYDWTWTQTLDIHVMCNMKDLK